MKSEKNYNQETLKLSEKMDQIYSNPLKVPWNRTNIPHILKTTIKNLISPPAKILDIGCGTGTYAIHLAKSGYIMTGIDFSQKAISLANKNSDSKNCRFLTADILGNLSELTETFDFVYEWELLHHIFPEQRSKYIANLSSLLKPGGYYLSVSISSRSKSFGDSGKVRVTPLATHLYLSDMAEISETFSKFFKMIEIKEIEIAGSPSSHKCIFALMQLKKSCET
jgi:2-polyprenyl-3-methyl-5-hydroxy-6-metoxy-1,4-benzoquinol methylase